MGGVYFRHGTACRFVDRRMKLSSTDKPLPNYDYEALEGGAPLCTYEGASMFPTLAEPDLLEIRPYGDRPVQVGDVVLFRPGEAENDIVHRVIRIDPRGIRTRGDNSGKEDDWNLKPGDIRGQVVAAWRGKRRRSIRGGPRGLAELRVAKWRREADRRFSRKLHPLYRRLSRSGLFVMLLPTRLRPRAVVFRTPDGAQIKVLLGSWVAARYDPHWRQWRVRRPFRLVLDSDYLSGLRNRVENPRRSDWWSAPRSGIQELKTGWDFSGFPG